MSPDDDFEDRAPRLTTRVRTLGQQKLIECGVSLGKIAAIAGTSKQSANRWRLGDARPDVGARERLEVELGIEADSWHQPPDAIELPRTAAAAKRAVESIDSIEEIDHMLLGLRESAQNASARDLASLAMARRHLLAQRRVFEMDRYELEMASEDAWVRSQGFDRFVAAIEAALEGMPEAVEALGAAVKAAKPER